jgi:hypothetical protein
VSQKDFCNSIGAKQPFVGIDKVLPGLWCVLTNASLRGQASYLESHMALRFAIEIEGARTVLMVFILVDA